MTPSTDIPTVAILVSPLLSWGRGIINGILAYATEMGPWNFLMTPALADQYDEQAGGVKIDGIIARVISPQLGQEINASGLPVVNVCDTPVDGFSAPCVRTDDRASARMAAEHFLERGFRHIAFVGKSDKPVLVWYEKAFRKELLDHGITCKTFWFDEYGPALEKTLLPWLLALPKPVGILSELGAARTLVGCCMDAGISIPHDVAVLSVGYENLMCRTCTPPLSGIISPAEQIGYQAAKTLHDMMRGEKVPHDTLYLAPPGIRENLSTDTLAVKDSGLARAIAYMREHAFESISIEDVLQASAMSRRTLSRRFQQALGRTPLDEIRRLRVNKAKQLLADTNLSLQDIAEACGLTSYSYLSTVFKQVAGLSPNEYRNQMHRR